MVRPVLFAALLATALTAWGSDHNRVNGSIVIDEGERAGDLSTVNGSIRIEENASAKEASTVNGSIRLENRATAGKASTVNGSVRLSEGARVTGDVTSVNGSLTLENGADVAGKLENVNGAIRLDAAHVGGGIRTVAGDIHVGANSRVEGGILVEKPQGGLNWDRGTPEVVIGPGAVVQGTLRFEREVELYVSDSAKIGKVEGATAQRFSGDHPED